MAEHPPSRDRATHSTSMGENILQAHVIKTTVIALHASIGDGWRELGNGVVERLHLDQKTVLLERNASCVGSELGQDLGVRGVGKLAPVHLDGKFLEIAPSFEHGSPGGQTTPYNGILEDRAGNHARRHHQQGHSVEDA